MRCSDETILDPVPFDDPFVLLFCLRQWDCGGTRHGICRQFGNRCPLDTVRPNSKTEAPETVTKMSVDVSGQRFTATLADNEATRTLVKMIREKPVVIHMSDYAGFEKVGSLGTRLPASNSQITTQAGDIMLYNGDQIVIFYGSHSWSYTKIGKIEELNGLEAALGSGDVTVTFSIEE